MPRLHRSVLAGIILSYAFASAPLGRAAENAAAPSVPLVAVQAPVTTNAPAADDAATTALRTLQDQQKELIRTLEDARRDSALEMKKNSEQIGQRLREIESALAQQRRHELEVQQGMNRTFLLALAMLGALGMIGLLIMGVLVLKTTRRLSDVATTVAQYSPALLGTGELPVTAPLVQPSAGSNAARQRFLESMSQLDTRLRELEQKSLLPEVKPTASQG